MLGVDNFRVEATTNIDFSTTKQTTERFEGAPIAIKENLTNDSKDASSAIGIPGSLSNKPPVTDVDEQADPQKGRNNSSNIQRDYVVGSSIITTDKPQGEIKIRRYPL